MNWLPGMMIVSFGRVDFRNRPVSGEPPFQALLHRDRHLDIAFHHRLASQSVSLGNIFGRKAYRATPPYLPIDHLHQAAPAPSLPAAWLEHLNPRQARCLRKQSTTRYAHRGRARESNEVIGHNSKDEGGRM